MFIRGNDCNAGLKTGGCTVTSDELKLTRATKKLRFEHPMCNYATEFQKVAM